MAVACIGIGVYLTFFRSLGYVKTSASIVEVEEVDDGDSTTYRPTVEFTADGKTYKVQLGESSADYSVGKTVDIMYYPGDPNKANAAGGFGTVIVIVIGVVLLVIDAAIIVMGKKKQRQAAVLREANGQVGYAPSVQGEERELYFLSDLGTTKVGHRIEDKDRNVLYEAKMTKFSVAPPTVSIL